MKIQDLAKATEFASKWRYLMELERALRDSPWRVIEQLFIPANTGKGINLSDLYNAGVDEKEINTSIRNLVAELLDRSASQLLSEMQRVGLETDTLETERENFITEADERNKKRTA